MFKKVPELLNKSQKLKVFLYFFFTLIVILFELLSLGIIIPLVASILNPEQSIKYLSILPIEIGSVNKDNIIIVIFVIFNILIISKNLILYLVKKYQVKFIADYQKFLQDELFNRYLFFPVSKLLNNNISIINRNVIDLSSEYVNNYLNPLLTIIADLVLLFFILIFLFLAEPFFTLSSIIVFSIFGISIFLITKKTLLLEGEKYKDNKSERIKTLNETFGAILEIKSFQREDKFYRNFKNITEILKNIQIKISILGFIPKLIFEIFAVLIITFFFLILFKNNLNLNDILPLIALFCYAIVRIVPIINKILNNAQRLKYSEPSFKEIYSVIKYSFIKSTHGEKFQKFDKEIELSNVSFEYIKNNILFENISIKVKKNDFIIITGASGSGKSTLLKIILGLFEPSKGDVLCDSNSIYLNINQWQKMISFVPQDVYILDDTFEKNITIGQEISEIDIKKYEKSVTFANLSKFVENLPRGKETILGDKGSKISGGQKQRIGLARAIYSDTEIIILDESTSSIDEKNELIILENLKELKKIGKTIIFVTHKKDLKKYCNEFYLLKDKLLVKK